MTQPIDEQYRKRGFVTCYLECETVRRYYVGHLWEVYDSDDITAMIS